MLHFKSWFITYKVYIKNDIKIFFFSSHKNKTNTDRTVQYYCSSTTTPWYLRFSQLLTRMLSFPFYQTYCKLLCLLST